MPIRPDVCLIKIRVCWRRFNLSRWSSSSSATLTPEQHAAHHVQQRVPLSGDFDGEILLANLSQSIVPDANFFDM